MKPRTVLFISKGANAASTRYRARAYFPYLQESGWRPLHMTASGSPIERLQLLRECARADVVVVVRKTFSGLFLALLRGGAKRLVFDFDDAIFLRSDGAPSRLRMGRFARMAGKCDLVWAGNAYLAEHAGRFNSRVAIVPTSLDPAKYGIAVHKPDDSLDLVWIGSKSTRKYLVDIIPTLEQIALKIPSLKLKIVADFSLESNRLPILPVRWDARTEAQEIASSHIGIAPMPDNPWTRGKCALKVLQYMAAGLPVVSSPAGSNAEIVEPGENGFLAAGDEQWENAILRLNADSGLRTRMGESGRKRVHAAFSQEATCRRMVELLDSLCPSAP
ncbi:MAG: glycosyltransferase family 4 protein [Burkholderiales bacterium]